MIRKILNILDNHFELILGSLCLLGMLMLTFLNIALRIIFKTTFPWFQELTRYLFVWMVFIALGACTQNSAHIRITFVQTFLGEKGHFVMEILVHLICIAFGAICFYYSIPMLASFHDASMTASSMPWFKMSWLYAVMPVGMALFVMRNIQVIIRQVINHRSSDKREEGTA